SRQLNEAEKRYGATEQECLGVVWAVRHFRCYLFGRHFRVITDCNAFKWLMSVRDPNSRLARWNFLLQEHSFEIVHRAGKLNQNADALSRAV
ncbi:polyprotein of retroviral origin, putative, partial [Ixodes scapularis]